MIENSLYKYIKDFILKRGEELEWNHPTEGGLLIEAKIYKAFEENLSSFGSINIIHPNA